MRRFIPIFFGCGGPAFWRENMDMKVEVEWYAGRKADDRSVCFRLDERQLRAHAPIDYGLVRYSASSSPAARRGMETRSMGTRLFGTIVFRNRKCPCIQLDACSD